MWGSVTGFLSAGEARRDWELTSCFLLPGLAASNFYHHLQTGQRSDQTCRSVTSRASRLAEAIILSERMCAATTCHWVLIWDNKPERERERFPRCFINNRRPGGEFEFNSQDRALGCTARTNMVTARPCQPIRSRHIFSIVGSLRDLEVACSASDLRGSNFEFCVWRAVSSHHPQEVHLACMCTKVARFISCFITANFNNN